MLFPSVAAVNTRPQAEVARLYFQSTQNEHYVKSEVAPLAPGPESLGHVHCIGQKKTKYMPFQYKSSPLLGADSCWYGRQFYEKPSEYQENRQLAESFRGRQTVQPSPMMETTSFYTNNFVSPSKAQAAFARSPSSPPPKYRTKITAGDDLNFVTESWSHSLHRAPPRFQGRNAKNRPLSNLGTFVDTSDCWSTTYGSHYPKTNVKSPSRSRSAPGWTNGLADGLQGTSSPKRDPEIDMVRRSPCMSPGK